MSGGGCCSPSRGGQGEIWAAEAGSRRGDTDGMVLVPAGSFWMGSDDAFAYPDDGEGPPVEIDLDAYWIDSCAVINAAFAAFVTETAYETEAERFGWSFVFAGLLPDDFPPTQAVAQAPWWRRVEGADWRHPEGPQSSLEDRHEHPVVHVSWNDAVTYARWAGKRLATEAEWERAARGGLDRKVFPWGDEITPAGEHRMNVWQGDFPGRNSLADGFLGTAPVRSFPPNGLGLYEMTGNVWEWTAHRVHATFRTRDRRRNPTGPPRGEGSVQKGGSYLCHHSYCRRYRVAARQLSTPESATGNVGFRCARDAP